MEELIIFLLHIKEILLIVHLKKISIFNQPIEKIIVKFYDFEFIETLKSLNQFHSSNFRPIARIMTTNN